MARILIMDDDRTTRAFIRQILIREGHEVFEAPNAKAGRDIYLETVFDVIVTDLLMPERDGIEALLELQEHLPRPKCLVISGAASEFLDVVLDLGADAILAKPLTEEGLQSVLTVFLADPGAGRSENASHNTLVLG